MIVFLLFFIAGLWMADGVALIFSPQRVIMTLRHSLAASPGFLRWGGIAAFLGLLLLVGTWRLAYQPLWIIVGFSMIAKGVFLYAGSAVDYLIWGLGLCTLSVLLLDALNWGRDQ